MVTTESGLQYKDIKVGQGPSPPVGFQVCNFSDLFSFPCMPVSTISKTQSMLIPNEINA